jgi:3-carboxy-cis,cis-muconate cycloisomerase
MGRPDAQRIAATLSIEAETTGIPLRQLAERDFPETDWAAEFAPHATLGQAPAEARAFAVAARQDR